MAITTGQPLRVAQRGFLEDYKALALALAASIGQLLIRYTEADGTVALSNLQTVQNQAQDLTLRLYVDPQQGPYSSDGVTPLADYPRALNRHVTAVMIDVLLEHSRWLHQRPPDIAAWLTLTPQTVNRVPRPFRSNPLAEYDPFHKWVDPRGWDLSQRIWEVGLNTRRKIGDYLDINIRQGTSAVKMAQQLEQFLVPGRRNITTPGPYPPPYGVTASFDGMRLARTEITRAHTDASFAAALANPYVTGMDWKLSPSHPRIDICDKLATIGMGGERLQEPYPLEEAPHVVSDSHPQCLCVNVPAVGDLNAINEDIRAIMEDYAAPPSLLAIDVQEFVIVLLGSEVVFQIQEALEI